MPDLEDDWAEIRPEPRSQPDLMRSAEKVYIPHQDGEGPVDEWGREIEGLLNEIADQLRVRLPEGTPEVTVRLAPPSISCGGHMIMYGRPSGTDRPDRWHYFNPHLAHNSVPSTNLGHALGRLVEGVTNPQPLPAVDIDSEFYWAGEPEYVGQFIPPRELLVPPPEEAVSMADAGPVQADHRMMLRARAAVRQAREEAAELGFSDEREIEERVLEILMEEEQALEGAPLSEGYPWEGAIQTLSLAGFRVGRTAGGTLTGVTAAGSPESRFNIREQLGDVWAIQIIHDHKVRDLEALSLTEAVEQVIEFFAPSPSTCLVCEGVRFTYEGPACGLCRGTGYQP